MRELKDKIANLPDTPGVYIFKNSQGEILYVGKAKSLKKRVQSYFSRLLSAKTQALVAKIADVEYQLTPSESQAQLLEASLIKEHQPQYNVSLKDDKSFPLIRITNEDFPIVSIYRRKKANKDDTALYFGPYTNVALLRQALKAMRRLFGFRSCKTLPKQMCLYGRLKLCPAPCVGKIDKNQYQGIIKNITLFLDSKHRQLLDKLSFKMKEAAAEQNFEGATRIRDQINALSAITNTAGDSAGLSQLEDLANLLKSDRIPDRIEGFDISNISGQGACGSMVSFYKGLPDKNNYRRFRIKTVSGIDDYAMLAEVIARRYTRLVKENLDLPDLILIDGGKSHLLVVNRQLQKLGLKIPLISIAKDKENIYIIKPCVSNGTVGCVSSVGWTNSSRSFSDAGLNKGRRQPIRFAGDRPALNLIRRIRNEAHRFALSYHHILRRKKTIGE